MRRFVGKRSVPRTVLPVCHSISATAMMLLPGLLVTLFSLPAHAQLQRSPVDGSSVTEDSVTDEELRLPVSEDEAQRIDRLLAELGSAAFAKRQTARNDLIKIGAPALAKLRDAYRTSTDLDVRLSLEQIIRNVYLNHHLLDANGFLGITQGRTRGNNPFVPRGGVGIEVGQVLAQTAAEKFGLQAGDVIVRLDGEPIPARRRGGRQDNFGELIRQRGPGTQVVMTIVRNREVFDLDVELGRRPEYAYEGQREFREDLYKVREQFAIWWDKFVRKPDDDG